MMSFVFDHEMIHKALLANGWYNHWHPDNWVHQMDSNPDWSGVNMKTAFERLLKSKNLIPANVNDCWQS
jgi:hypothetical protein